MPLKAVKSIQSVNHRVFLVFVPYRFKAAGVRRRRKKQTNFRYTLGERTAQVVGVDVAERREGNE